MIPPQDKDNKMSDDLLQKAIDFATEKHKGQKYGDKPYITHCLAVLERVKKVRPGNPDILAAAVLHEVREDCGVSHRELHELFGHVCSDVVLYLTREEDYTYAEYIESVEDHPYAKIVKIADLEENLSNNPPNHLKDKYELALLYLRK